MSHIIEIEESLSQRNIKFKVVNDELKLDHPTCGDRRGRLYFSTSKCIGFCHNCSTRISKKDFEKLFKVKISTNASMSGLEKDIARMEEWAKPKSDHHVCVALPPTVPVWDSPAATKYLCDDRGITDEQIEEYGIRYCHRGNFSNRIIIPVIDNDYSLVSFVARSVTDNKKKYLYASGVSLNGTLFGLYKHHEEKNVLMVEGVFDYFRVEHAHPCVASFGKKLSEHAVKTLKDTKVQNIGLMWDEDAAEEAAKTAKRFSKDLNITVIPMPVGVKDPAELSETQLNQLIRRWKDGRLL